MLLQFTNSHPVESNGSVSGEASTGPSATVTYLPGPKVPALPPSPRLTILRCREVEKRFGKAAQVPQLCCSISRPVRLAYIAPQAKDPSPPPPAASCLRRYPPLRPKTPDSAAACAASSMPGSQQSAPARCKIVSFPETRPDAGRTSGTPPASHLRRLPCFA